jgi:hypothetical protein
VPVFGHFGLKRIVIAGALLDMLPMYNLSDTCRLLPSRLHICELNLIACFINQNSAQLLIEACRSLKSLVISLLVRSYDHMIYLRMSLRLVRIRGIV